MGEVLMVSLLILVATQPFWYGSLMRSEEGLLHLYRLVALDQAVGYGDLWPRYVPTLFFGYGLPLFNFYSPVSLYPLELLHLAGLDFIRSLIGGILFYVWLGALGAYQLGKGWGGGLAGIGTALAYTYAPFSLVEALPQGALDEVAGLAILPWLLWAFHQLAVQGRRRDFIAASLSLSLLILLHNFSTLYGLLILIPYALALWWTGRRPALTFIQALLAGSLAAGLSAFFWLPALLEAETIQSGRMALQGMAGDPASLPFRSALISFSQLVQPPPPADLTLFNRTGSISLSLPALILAGLGGGLMLWRPPVVQAHSLKAITITLMGLAALLIFSVTPASMPLRAILPLEWQNPFPAQAVGAISLILALLAGLGMARLAEFLPLRRKLAGLLSRLVWVSLCTVAVILYSLPWLYQLYIPDPPARTVRDVQDFEREPGYTGEASSLDTLPIWVHSAPNPRKLIGLYQHGDVIPRLNPLDSVSLQQAQWGPMSAQISLTAASEASLTFDWVYYPGWWAQLDGTEVEVFPTEPNGLLGITVPPGQHDLEIGFGPTPLRLGAMIASGLALILLLAALVLRRLWPEHSEPPAHPLSGDFLLMALSACAAAGAILALKITLIDNTPTPFQRARFAEGIAQGTQHPVRANFGDQMILLGYDLRHPQFASGSGVDLTLYWQLAGPSPADDLTSRVYLIDAQGTVIASSESPAPGGWPTHALLPGFYLAEPVALQLPPGTPPGEYFLKSMLVSYTTQSPLAITDSAGNSPGPILPFGQITVTRPAWPANPQAFKASQPDALLIDQAAADGIHLIGVLPPPARAEIGQTFMGLALWQADRRITQEYQVRVIWLDDQDQVKGALPPRDLAVNSPTSQWGSGDRWRGVYPLSVPGRLNLGTYRVALEVLDAQGAPAGPAIVIGQMMVSAPVRTYHPPETDYSASAMWSNSIWLIGYTIESLTVAQGDGLRLALIWQAQADVYDSLSVSVHLIDAQGRIVAQQDSIPASGRRPTTGWSPAEFVTDRYALFIAKNVPVGRYQILVGWVDVATGQRVLLSDGADFAVLPQAITITAP
jgi:hypothetical protein